MSTVAPLSLLSAVIVLDSTLDDWSLLEPAGGLRRSFRQPVTFDRQFSVPPLVHVGLVGIDASKEDNLRLSLRAQSITEHGFVLCAETWLNTKIWSVEVSWLAIGS
ncbi:MAG TPA: H-type lectin domain-containing protein [Polyangiaceae bacterium]|nr:H-type lectin domain-containing protein [Polyangiaceae bacterium]